MSEEVSNTPTRQVLLQRIYLKDASVEVPQRICSNSARYDH